MANLTITLTITNTQQLEGLEAALAHFADLEGCRRTDACRGNKATSSKPDPKEWSADDERALAGARQLLAIVVGVR